MNNLTDDRSIGATPFAQTYFHGTKAYLNLGDLITPGYTTNYDHQKKATHIYFTATLDAAIWGAELAGGNTQERIYLVEPLGKIEHDPELTDRKFPGNPTLSYRSTEPCRVVGEVTAWISHAPAQLNAMKSHLEKLRRDSIS